MTKKIELHHAFLEMTTFEDMLLLIHIKVSDRTNILCFGPLLQTAISFSIFIPFM